MKTDFVQVSGIFRSSLAERRAGPGSGCPSPKDLVQLVVHGLGKRTGAKVMMHVSNCASCAQEVRSILRLSGEIDTLTGKVEAVQGCPQADDLGERRHVGPIFGRRAAIAILAGLIGLTIIAISVTRLQDQPAMRGAARSPIRLVSPKQGASHPINEITFKWKAVPGARHYYVEVFDKSLATVWRSGSLTGTAIELPADAGAVLPAGGTYFWRITAVLEGGEEIPSRLAEFSIRK